MFNIGEFLVYKRDVCKLIGIKNSPLNNMIYYVLTPLSDLSLKIEVPIEENSINIRKLMTKEQIEELIKQIPTIEIIEVNDNKFMEYEYKKLLLTGNPIELIKIIKTTYLRNKKRIDEKKKIGDIDNNYFKLAEKYFYQEISAVLNMNYVDVKNYVIRIIDESC